ncbi:MAG: 3-methyl-2-oxobutanoate hydroxymethyltransferase [Armatimonadetes bacterium]|nr:MAG: 3-methyl-2-oxobutanoate hydroxymethyltransferase [Armatimonadota bacterium]MCE7899384.1 3-methyl-2-oxobutanoate hydroxymethyltransferase [Armatimonadetes bacterium ATM1]MDL1927959.1 3-methyl-2-oxobutanoate hydroxymethyltransferase [Fimbriimonadia bacterium ATM]MBC6969277.1 3-methyl-2-oxobutanoate hydroxymethyltransferase [Armatimonadota bacterium]MBL1149540.1 3-methyl-2-oxobutanoate hydroxymethyltransferase [Armatimonadota bacterium]
MSEKVTAPSIRGMKGQRIVCVTAYDAPSARVADEAGVDLVLVGDSVGNVLLGYDSTLPVSLEEMIHHTKAARAGCKRALLVSDMPFGTYQTSPEDAVRSACALVRAGAEAVKLEGAFVDAIAAIVATGIPVMGHVGMTPQSVNAFGGYRVQGRGKQAELVVEAARKVADAGAFCIVLEVIPAVVAERITSEIAVPTIGIGAGPHCDGEVQVFHDIMGLSPGEPYKHTRRFLNGATMMVEAMRQYADAVRSGTFPDEENTF